MAIEGERQGTRAMLLAGCALALLAAGCNPDGGAAAWNPFAPSAEKPVTASASETETPRGAPPAPVADTRTNPGPLIVSALHVRVPQEGLEGVDAIWNHLYEQVLDAQTLLTLRQNGIRVAVGHARFWDAVRAVLDTVEGRRVDDHEPIIVPRGYPLLLELDDHPHPQTLFVFDHNGSLSGATLPAGRNRLRLTAAMTSRERPRAQLFVVPEVGQQRDHPFWLESGEDGDSREKCTTFPSCGVSVALSEQEFLVLAPADPQRNESLVGGAFLTDEIDGNRYYSYIFIRPEFTRVGSRNQQ
jgi:hypothetical protein